MAVSVEKKKDTEENPEERKNWQTCPVEFTKNRIAGKWKLLLLWHIYDKKVIRYGELKTCVHGITHKMLSNQLKELIEFELVDKEMYHQVPPKTEYSLSEKGKTIVPILELMYDWGIKNMS
jgi:DNA-binding HxlR family transcriptional regulator